MAGFPLMAIGAGIGRGIDAIQQQQVRRAQLQRYQQQQDAESALGQLLGSGDINSLFGGGQIPSASPLGTGGFGTPGAGMLPRVPDVAGNLPSQVLQPSITNVRDVPPQSQPDPMTGGTPMGVMPLGDTPEDQAAAESVSSGLGLTTTIRPDAGIRGTQMNRDIGAVDAAANAAAANAAPAGTPGGNLAPGFSRTPSGGLLRNGASPSMYFSGTPAWETGGGTSAPATPAATPAATTGTGASTATPPPDPQHNVEIQNPLMQRLLGPQINLGQVAQAIKRARPDADPGTVWRATSMLYEMLEKGNTAQMNTALRAYSALSLATSRQANITGIDPVTGKPTFQSDKATGTVGGKPTVAQQQANTAAANLEERIRNNKVHHDDAVAKANQAQQRGDTHQAYLILSNHLNFIRNELNSIRSNMPAGKDRDAQIKALQDQANEIQKRMNNLQGAAAEKP